MLAYRGSGWPGLAEEAFSLGLEAAAPCGGEASQSEQWLHLNTVLQCELLGFVCHGLK